jgi:hypothetical protein
LRNVTFSRLLRPGVGLLASTIIFLATGEAVLRVIYRDRGEATLGGPGGRLFEHLYIKDKQRNRFDTGPRRPGVERLLVVGDSISWGAGVRDWSAIWTEQLARALERRRGAVEMAVVAEPGRDMWEHMSAVQEWGSRVQPDVLIYQWYVNDIEVVKHRPRFRRSWQRWSQHARLRDASYLYYFLDHMAASWLPLSDRSYPDYILQDFLPGTYEWAEFERAFHSFATRARESAPIRLMVLYPLVPFRGAYSMQPIHDRMRTLAGPHHLIIPPSEWVPAAGTMAARAGTGSQPVVRVPSGVAGAVIETRDYYLSEGTLEMGVRLVCDSPPGGATVLALEAVDHLTGRIVGRGSATVDPQARGWQEVPVRVDIRGINGHSVRLRLVSPGGLALAIASIDIPVDYGLTVVDLTEPLNTFNTHVSIFDAHPNARAHAVIAREVLAALERLR